MLHCNVSVMGPDVLGDSMQVAEVSREGLVLVWFCGSGEILRR